MNENERKAREEHDKEQKRLLESPRVLDRLRARTSQYADQLAQERREHIIRINTLATEAFDSQREYIKELEARVQELEAKLEEKNASNRGNDGPNSILPLIC